MQGKVSMVMPCYNKEEYIGAMLQSVYNQVWDNIELIMVNDGSTDRTRDVIAEWEPKLIARGFEVVIIDQENGGCCAAVYAGLLRMTGDYFCLVDSDDELHPEYVSRMAGWLDEHEDYEWAACHFELVSNDGNNRVHSFNPASVSLETPRLLENYLLWRTTAMVWIYMARVSYVKKCGLIEAFYSDRSVTYEPCIAIPLAAGEGKLKFFNEPLYIYNKFASDLSAFPVFEKVLSYYGEYLDLSVWVIKRLDLSDKERKRYIDLARLIYKFRITAYLNVPKNEKYHQTLAEDISVLLDEMLTPPPAISPSEVLENGFSNFFYCVRYKLLDLDKQLESKLQGKTRIIGYGALGKAGQRTLPVLISTALKPTVIWDKSANVGTTVDGVPAEQPDFSSLSNEDAVVVFPTSREVLDELEPILERSNAGVVLYQRDFGIYLRLLELPGLKLARCVYA